MGIKNRLKDKESPSGLTIDRPFNPDGDIPCNVWIDDFQYGFSRWNNNHQDTPQNTIFKLLGSTSNTKHMVNAEAKFNGIKGLVSYFLRLFPFVIPTIVLTHLLLVMGV